MSVTSVITNQQDFRHLPNTREKSILGSSKSAPTASTRMFIQTESNGISIGSIWELKDSQVVLTNVEGNLVNLPEQKIVWSWKVTSSTRLSVEGSLVKMLEQQIVLN